MGVFATDKNQLTYIYSSKSDLGKKVLGYIDSLEDKCRIIDIVNDPIPDTAWTEIAEMASVSFDELFSIKQAEVNATDSNTDFNTDDWLKVIKKNPEVLQKPIVIKGDSAKQVDSRSEALQYFGVDSAGLDKKMSDDLPTTSSTTENETFVPK